VCNIVCFDINYFRLKYKSNTSEILNSIQEYLKDILSKKINSKDIRYPNIKYRNTNIKNFERDHLIATNIHGR
jgi:hypothetical protein